MDESDITSSSIPYIEVKLGNDKEKPLYKISTNQSETGYYDGGNFIADGTALIQSANIDGVVPMGRQGNITLIDISGTWTSRMADVGKSSSSMLSPSGPNIYISFGWRGLQANKEYSGGKSHINEMDGFIQGVKFDIGDDASVTITIDFVAYSAIAFNDIIAWGWDDFIKTAPDKLWKVMQNITGATTANSGGSSGGRSGPGAAGGNATGYGPNIPQSKNANCTAADVINYVLAVPDWDYPVIGKQQPDFAYSKSLASKKIIVQVGTRMSEYVAEGLTGNSDLTSIEFGESLSSWLQKMLEKVVLNADGQKKAEEKKLVITLEKQNDKDAYTYSGRNPKFKDWTLIVYDWKAVADQGTTSGSAISDIAKYNLEVENRYKYNNGPMLYWKNGTDEYAYLKKAAKVVEKTYEYDGADIAKVIVDRKRVLSWSSNLSSMPQLFRLFKDEFRDKLNEVKSNENYGDFLKIMQKFDNATQAEDFFKGKMSGLNRLATFGVGGPSKKTSDAAAQAFATTKNIGDAVSNMGNITQRTATNRDQTFASILANNVFTVDVEVIGDPDLGTRLPGGNTIISTDFHWADQGYLTKVFGSDKELINIAKESLVNMFSRQWILMSSNHSISDGKYTTKLQLIGYIPLIDAKEYAENRAAERAGGGLGRATEI